MTFDYTSDLHIDLTFGRNRGISLCEYFKDASSEYLLVAGDIGHNIKENIFTLEYIKKRYGYKEVIIVLGNHDRYINRKEGLGNISGLAKKHYSAEMYELSGIRVLDGDTIDVNGVIIGGADGWYDGEYGKNTNNYPQNIHEYWKNCINDYSYQASNDFLVTFSSEKQKIEALYGKCDIILSHFRPTINDNHVSQEYVGHLSNMFFGFDYEEQVKSDPRLKVWVYGHVHDVADIHVGDKRLLCNPLGYFHEHNTSKMLRSFKV